MEEHSSNMIVLMYPTLSLILDPFEEREGAVHIIAVGKHCNSSTCNADEL